MQWLLNWREVWSWKDLWKWKIANKKWQTEIQAENEGWVAPHLPKHGKQISLPGMCSQPQGYTAESSRSLKKQLIPNSSVTQTVPSRRLQTLQLFSYFPIKLLIWKALSMIAHMRKAEVTIRKEWKTKGISIRWVNSTEHNTPVL